MRILLLLFLSSLVLGRGYTKNGFVASASVEQSECTAQTTSASTSECMLIAIPDNSAYEITAGCTGIKDDVSEFVSIKKMYLVQRATSNASVEGSVVVIFDQPSSSSWDITLGTSTTNAQIEVKGASSTTVDWTCVVNMEKKI